MEYRHTTQFTQPPLVKLPVYNEKPRPKWWSYFLAGELSGMIGAFICHPFDTTKTRMQMQNSATTHAQSTFKLMRGIYIKEGIFTFYRGILYPFCGFGLLFSISFGINGICRNYFIQKNIEQKKENPTELPISQLMIGGILAGAGSSILRTPIERVKCWSQNYNTSTWTSTKTLYQNYGIRRGICFGGVTTMAREVPQFAVYYPIYEVSCSILSPSSKGNKKQTSNGIIFLSGASAGIGCWVVTYPIDVIKTRIQCTSPGTYRGMMHCASEIYANGGLKNFWIGIMPTIYRAALLHSAIFLVYERTLSSICSNL